MAESNMEFHEHDPPFDPEEVSTSIDNEVARLQILFLLGKQKALGDEIDLQLVKDLWA